MDDAAPLPEAEAAQGAAARAAFDAMGELVLARDAQGRVTEVNKAFLDAFGGEREDWLGRWFAVAPGIGADGKARRYDAQMRTRKGDLWIEWMEYPTEPEGSVAVGRDVSDRRKAEEALNEAAQGRSVFFAAVTHELRTPLSGALGAARLLEDTGLRPDQTAYVEALKSSAGHALALVDDILDLSRLEAGKLSLRAEPVDLRALLEEVCELLAPRAAEKGLDLAHACARAVPRLVEADPARVKQILFNLIGNAVKFTEAGGALVTIETAGGCEGAPETQEGCVTLRLAVRDTGPGISRPDQDRLFNHFERGAAERDGCKPGAGLGLAMVKRLAEAMGGEVGVESRPGEGALFWMTAQLAVLEAAPTARPLADFAVQIVSPSDIRRRALLCMVEALGGAASASAAPDAAAVAADIVLLDEAFAERAPDCAPARVLILAKPQTKDRYGLITRPDGVDGWLVMPARERSLAQFARPGSVPDEEAGPARPDPRRTALSGLRFLLAEDDPVNRMIARTVVERLGGEAQTAADGRLAFSMLRRGGFDLALIDMRMPEMDGLAVARAVRELNDAAAAVPMIALTANATEEDRRLCLDAGMDAFLAKPLDPDALIAAVERLCSGGKKATVNA